MESINKIKIINEENDILGKNIIDIKNMKELLRYIFCKIGIHYKKCIEFGGNGIISNTADLILNHNFYGLIFDTDDKNIELGIDYYKVHNKLDLVTFVTCNHNITDIIDIVKQLPMYRDYIDLLSLNMSTNDFWILSELIKSITSRVIIVKYQIIIGSALSLTVPYDANPLFHPKEYDTYGGLNYYGASLRAYINLLECSYSLISFTDNFAVFLNNNDTALVTNNIRKLTEDDIEYIFNAYNYNTHYKNRFNRVKDLPWIHIDAKGEVKI